MSNYTFILNIINDINTIIDIKLRIDRYEMNTKKTIKYPSSRIYSDAGHVLLPINVFNNKSINKSFKLRYSTNLNKSKIEDDYKIQKDYILEDIRISDKIDSIERCLKILIISILWNRKIFLDMFLIQFIYDKLINLPSFVNEICNNNKSNNITKFYEDEYIAYKTGLFDFFNYNKEMLGLQNTDLQNTDLQNKEVNNKEKLKKVDNILPRYQAMLEKYREILGESNNTEKINEIKTFIKKYFDFDGDSSRFNYTDISSIKHTIFYESNKLNKDDLYKCIEYIYDLSNKEYYTSNNYLKNLFCTKTILDENTVEMKFLINLIDKIYLLMGRDISKNYTLQKGKIKGSAWYLSEAPEPDIQKNLLGYLFYINGFLLGRWLKSSDYSNGKFLINSLKTAGKNINSNNKEYLEESNKISISRNRSHNNNKENPYITNFEKEKKLIKNTL